MEQIHPLHQPERTVDESFREYKERRLKSKQAVMWMKIGKLVWAGKTKAGSFKHKPPKAERKAHSKRNKARKNVPEGY